MLMVNYHKVDQDIIHVIQLSIEYVLFYIDQIFQLNHRNENFYIENQEEYLFDDNVHLVKVYYKFLFDYYHQVKLLSNHNQFHIFLD